jgi:hypothetical protein
LQASVGKSKTGGRLRAAIALEVQEYKRSTAQELKDSENDGQSQRRMAAPSPPPAANAHVGPNFYTNM